MINQIEIYKPKNFLEIGIFQGVTSRNVCEVLDKIHKGKFLFHGIDLFENTNQDIDNNEHNSTIEEIIDDSSTALDLSKTAKKSEKNVEHVKPITPPKIPTQSVVFNQKNQVI